MAPATPWPRGWSNHSQKAKKKRRRKWVLGRRGWPKPPPSPFGWSDHPLKAQNSFSPFLVFCLLEVARSPPWPWGWFVHPHTGHGGGLSTPIPAMGVAPVTPIFFFLFFLKRENFITPPPKLSGLCTKHPWAKKTHLPLLIFHFLLLWTLKGPKRHRFNAQKRCHFGAQNDEFRV